MFVSPGHRVGNPDFDINLRMEDKYNCIVDNHFHLFEYIKTNVERYLPAMNKLYVKMKHAQIFRFIIKDGEQTTNIFEPTITALMDKLNEIAVLYQAICKFFDIPNILTLVPFSERNSFAGRGRGPSRSCKWKRGCSV